MKSFVLTAVLLFPAALSAQVLFPCAFDEAPAAGSGAPLDLNEPLSATWLARFASRPAGFAKIHPTLRRGREPVRSRDIDFKLRVARPDPANGARMRIGRPDSRYDYKILKPRDQPGAAEVPAPAPRR